MKLTKKKLIPIAAIIGFIALVKKYEKEKHGNEDIDQTLSDEEIDELDQEQKMQKEVEKAEKDFPEINEESGSEIWDF